MDVYNSESICTLEHRKSFICLTCNILLCSQCVVNHYNHDSQDVETLKSNLTLSSTSSNISTIHNNNNNNFKINNQIESIWNQLKDNTTQYNRFELRSNEISSHFQTLHEYLVVEERRLQKPIVERIDQIKQSIQSQIVQLKSLVNIVNYTVNSNSNKDGGGVDHSMSDENSQTSDDETDTTDRYQLETLIKSITISNSLEQFIKLHRNTLFYHQQDEQHQLPTDTKLLDLIHEYLKHQYQVEQQKHQQLDQQPQNDIIDFEIFINKFKNTQMKGVVRDTIVMHPRLLDNKHLKRTMILSSATSSDNKTSLSLFDITVPWTLTSPDNEQTLIESKEVDITLRRTYNSMVRVNDLIYIFASPPWKPENRLFIYSIQTKSIVETIDVDKKYGGGGVSVCFDGDDYIYMMVGCYGRSADFNRKINRFRVSTREFEECFTLPELSYNHILSFFYEGMLYSLTIHHQSLYIFDPKAKTLSFFTDKNLAYPYAACTDGNEINTIEYQIRNEIVTLSHSNSISEIQTLHHSIKSGLDNLNQQIKKASQKIIEKNKSAKLKQYEKELAIHKEEYQNLTSLQRKLNLQATKNLQEKYKNERKELLSGSSNITHQSRLNKNSSNEEIIKKSVNITETMKRTRNILNSQVIRSSGLLDEIDESSKVIEKTLVQQKEYSQRTSESKSLMTKLKRRDMTDRFLILFGFVVFLLVVLYIIKSRVGSWRIFGIFSGLIPTSISPFSTPDVDSTAAATLTASTSSTTSTQTTNI
ncbi:sec20 family protein [Heterostelium album PN500]|uniref:Sec20 family protein n=1 Tax=Heterostelium pallidum (strain ATCC 26659 / Pp 5 / PN500) TaxID=670386 RepID=D3BA98_HETP5|nr:sec20 family protein [Heterostelium album PN500]EFA81485.1 sec20 family protein [Heterostelium album PN500]|eukprot:XP_020433603.1 sec20 family protein [Heterostelium album PN500]